MKSNSEVVTELIDLIFDKIDNNFGGNAIMLKPAINIMKMKVANLNNDDCNFIVDAIHQISHKIEIDTGVLSPYHGIDSGAAIAKIQ